MSALLNVWLSKEKLEELLRQVGNNKGIAIDISVKDNANQHNQNVEISVGRNSEQIAKKEYNKTMFYGRVVFVSHLGIKRVDAPKNMQQSTFASNKEDLPF